MRVYKVRLRPTDKVLRDNEALPPLKQIYTEYLTPAPVIMTEDRLIKALKTGLVLEAEQIGELAE